MTWAQYVAALKQLLTDVTIGDTVATRAVAEYVRAQALSFLANDQPGHLAGMARYNELKGKLLGHTITLSDAALQAAVRGLLTDVTISDTLAIGAVADFVKGRIAREVDRDAGLHDSYMANWNAARLKLLGYTITINAAALRTAVNKLITVDAARLGIYESGGFIDTEIEQANQLLIGLTGFVNNHIAQAKIDLNGCATLLDKDIRNAVLDLQQYVPQYRTGHETIVLGTAMTEAGEADSYAMPAGAMPEQACVRATTEPTRIIAPLNFYSWDARADLIAGNVAVRGGQRYITLDPRGAIFYVYPPVEDDAEVQFIWDGIKIDFIDADVVPFDNNAIKAGAAYVLWQREKNPQLKRMALGEYQEAKFLCYSNARATGRFSGNKASPQPYDGCANMTACVTA